MKTIIVFIRVIVFIGVICGLFHKVFQSSDVTVYKVLQSNDVTIYKDGEATCGVVCGLMYTCDHRATEEDFKNLLEKTENACTEEFGTASSYRTEEGELKHAVIIGDDEVIAEQGTEFISCIINWEASKETALKAFKEVCLERRFQAPPDRREGKKPPERSEG